MKIRTGLYPKVSQGLRYPQQRTDVFIERARVELPVVADVDVLDTVIITFHTPEDTAKYPRGTVVKAMVVNKPPTKIEQQFVDVEYVQEAKGMDAYVEHMLRDRDVPDDAVLTVTPSYGQEVVHKVWSWWEIEL